MSTGSLERISASIVSVTKASQQLSAAPLTGPGSASSASSFSSNVPELSGHVGSAVLVRSSAGDQPARRSTELQLGFRVPA